MKARLRGDGLHTHKLLPGRPLVVRGCAAAALGITLLAGVCLAVAPGASDKVVVRYEPGNSKGSFNNKAFVETNDPVFPVISLTLAGSIPSCLFLGEVTPWTPTSQDLTISLRNGRPFQVISVKSSIEAMQCSYTDSLGTTAKLTFHLTVASEADPVVGDIDIRYVDQGSDKPKALSVPVYGYLVANGKSDP